MTVEDEEPDMHVCHRYGIGTPNRRLNVQRRNNPCHFELGWTSTWPTLGFGKNWMTLLAIVDLQAYPANPATVPLPSPTCLQIHFPIRFQTKPFYHC